MLRTHTCGELNKNFVGSLVTLCGWVHRTRDMGGMTFVDLRDRYGITQLVFNMEINAELCRQARESGREYVIKATGEVTERSNKNLKIATGEIEIIVTELIILNASKTPPFTIEDHTDGGEDIRMKYRYLDIKRNPLQQNLLLRHKMAQAARNYLDLNGFIEVETPVLINSTPEGARDFIVPSRMNAGEFYALPQSPQIFKQLLMAGGMDRYFQIVKCFRDEDLRADRQPEFTQIDCEMSFAEREDILNTFEGLIRHLFLTIKGIELPPLQRMNYEDALKYYGTDKPDTRFDMKLVELKNTTEASPLQIIAQGKNFPVFEEAQLIAGISVKGGSRYTRKQTDEITEFVKSFGARGLVHVKFEHDGIVKSSADKYYDKEELIKWKAAFSAADGDLLLIAAGEKNATRNALSQLRLKIARQEGLIKNEYAALWVVDFPLLEWNEESKRWFAMHHPFTAPVPEDIMLLDAQPGNVKANAYDMVINGVEAGGGSLRIHTKTLQQKIFNLLGFTPMQAEEKFGFLMNAFEYGAPPHGGIAFGFDRLCALFGGTDSIRDFIAFPKNNSGKDVMINAPAPVDEEQLRELHLRVWEKG